MLLQHTCVECPIRDLEMGTYLEKMGYEVIEQVGSHEQGNSGEPESGTGEGFRNPDEPSGQKMLHRQKRTVILRQPSVKIKKPLVFSSWDRNHSWA